GVELPAADRAAAEALKAHLGGQLNPDAFFLVEAGALGRDSTLRKEAEKAPGAVVIPCYEDEAGDVARMIREGLAKDKVGLTNEALELLRNRLPHERGVARPGIGGRPPLRRPGRGGGPPPRRSRRLPRRRARGLPRRRRDRRLRRAPGPG